MNQIRDNEASAPAELRKGGELAMRIALARAEIFSVHALACRMVASAEHGLAVGNEGSILRLAMSEVEQTIMRLAIEVLGPAALSHQTAGEWAMGYFSSFAQTIAGGTSEIQRNIIGERMLGLPR
jgi:alkylation response protein AidB-like acyl-CoA dehydrogenase